MKKVNQFIHRFSFGVLFSGLLLLPQMVKSQALENDPRFNTSDNKSASGTNGVVFRSVIQPDNKTIITGYFSHYNNRQVNNLTRLNLDGQPDKSFNSGTGADHTINALALQLDNKIIIGGDFTSYNDVPANRIARLNRNGKLDKTFITGTGANANVLSVYIQTNGKILVGGEFTSYDDTPVKKLVRLNKDGTFDDTFNFSDSVKNVENIVVQQDGKIIVSGNLANYRQYLIRLNRNGSRDHTFSYPDLFSWGYPTFETVILQGNKILVGGGIASGIEERRTLLLRLNSTGSVDTTFEYNNVHNVWIKSLALQQDGKIIMTGRSSIYSDDDVSSNYIGRLNASGSDDPTFKEHYEERNNAISANTVSIQTDGKIIVGGFFSTVDDLLTDNIVRLNNNGDFDLTFNQKTGANGSIFSSAKQSDGAILIGGNFSSYNYKLVNRIARLKKNGSLDPSFNSGAGANGTVYTIAVQSNGKIIIGGDFTSYDNEPCSHIARLNKNGTLDKNFNSASVNGVVYTVAIQPNGKIIIGGEFTNVNGSGIINVARLHANGIVDQGFSSPLLVGDWGSAVYVCKIQKNGKLLVGGDFTELYPSGSRYYNLVRLNYDGNFDGEFKGGVPKSVYAIALQSDNKILIGGGRVQHGYWELDPFKGYILRLNPDGTDDSLFKSPFKVASNDLGNPVRTITVLKNGKIFFGGQFEPYNRPALNHIGLLNENGTVDSSFAAHANSNVFTSFLVGEEKMILAGDFTLYNDVVRTGIARVSVGEEAISYGNSITDAATAAIVDAPSLVIFPNPASSNITLSNVVSGSKLTIRNALGELMEARIVNNDNTTVKLENYANGIYFVTAENNGTLTNLKFIVNR